MVDEQQKATVKAGIEALIELGEPLRGLIYDYLSDEPPLFSGRLFDRLPNNTPNEFTADDLVALAALDVPMDRVAVEQLLGAGRGRFNRLLAQIPDDVYLLNPDPGDHGLDEALAAADELWEALQEITGIGWVRAHKLIARKRPELHPVYDRVVKEWFAPANGIRHFLPALVDDGFNVAGELSFVLDPDFQTGLSDLRLLDIAVWMCGSTQEAAAASRKRHGVEPPADRVFATG